MAAERSCEEVMVKVDEWIYGQVLNRFQLKGLFFKKFVVNGPVCLTCR